MLEHQAKALQERKTSWSSTVFDYWMKPMWPRGWMCEICQASIFSKSPIQSQTEEFCLIDSTRIDLSRLRDTSELRTMRKCKRRSMHSKKRLQPSKDTLSLSSEILTGESFAHLQILTSSAGNIMTSITENSRWLSELRSLSDQRSNEEACYFKG